jgi:membrane protease YdiL (CAAX protease family)
VNEPNLKTNWRLAPIWALFRVLLFMVLVIVCMLVAGQVISLINPALFPSLGLYGQCISEILMLLFGAALSAVFLRKELSQFIDDIGLIRQKASVETILGFALGMVIVSTMFGVMSLCGGYSVSRFNWPIDFVPALILYFFAGLTEEFLFRGFIFRTFEKSGGTIFAIVMSSLAFGFAHFFNMPDNATLGYKIYACLILSFEAGLPLSGAFLLTRSLWLATGFHWAWNFFEGTIFGVAVSGTDPGPTLFDAKVHGNQYISGGVFGPEAGLPFFMVGVLCGIAMIYLALKRGQWSLTAVKDTVPVSPKDL